MTRPFRFDRTWELPIAPVDVWARLGRTDQYTSWWAWLREFDAPALAPGVIARCRIQSPLSYSLRCRIRVVDVQPAARVVTEIDGDLRGPAVLELSPVPAGTAVRMHWSFTLGNPALAAAAVVARPAMAWAHDQVVAVAFEQFRRRAIRDVPGAAPFDSGPVRRG